MKFWDNITKVLLHIRKSVREQPLSMGETGAEGNELGSEIFMHIGTGVSNIYQLSSCGMK